MPTTAQDLMTAAQNAYDTAAAFTGNPTIAAQVSAVQTLLDKATTDLSAANASVTTLNAEITAAKADLAKALADLP